MAKLNHIEAMKCSRIWNQTAVESPRLAGCGAGVRTDAVSQGDSEDEAVVLLGSDGSNLVYWGLTRPSQAGQTGFLGTLRLQGVEEIRGRTGGSRR